ncbi:hsp70-binding protein 1-like isoform X2 [Dreissena polymorpha]|uniref:Nucleotide exchange factor Fes1 domain-containing protein n=1 Tax=Dreissena polymorpha TaxID=45954 RepID=A0A9D4RZR9_DREPO|nr:hsp70-binding protein 1-like isoform X2 [Dreissena polymorpha]XP_052220831.1 hsp70-binding protein 1-like isoform X2 [Dreissena polymorpha]XP_052220838.1 hsp70-binding protein 1-like isoform X2 [Dreissena polymorpha]KAH3884552.1 hypothetical protein DPMN_008535 [Dreissena polymorpha]
MASEDPNDNRSQRLPKDMKGLLKFCAQTADTEKKEDVVFQPMDPERKAWLHEALNSMSVSHVEEMRKSISIIQDNDSDADDKIEALESLINWCDSIDFAMDFHKIGGFTIFLLCLEHVEPELRWQCLNLIATLTQNNPYCQAAVLQAGLLPTLLAMLDTDTDPTVRTKALYAISCLTRDSQDALDQFISQDGFSVVMRAMQADVEKLKIKSAFMLSSIFTDNNTCKDILCDMGMIDQLVGHLSEEHSLFHEHVLSAILTVIRNHPRSLRECQKAELNLVTLLEQKLRDLKGIEEFQEEYQYVQELLPLVKCDNSVESDVAR